ncbi:DMT family transporter [Alteraurantiacibacter palmitatis]|uniref:DMT family transporter n=1 Tax=Alteraurantiacibacter palmitatis TaxID=2054628 RepID=A0ABV7E5M8_9SPHN
MTSARHDRPLLALAIRLGGVMGLSIMAALIKLASTRGIHLAEIIFWRQFTTVPILLAWAWFAGQGAGVARLKALATKRPRDHAMRGIYGMIGMVFNFGAVILLPLAEATTINFSAPIWAVILSIIFLKEKVGVWRWSAVLAGFAGILVIAQPGDGHIPLVGAAVAMAGAFMIALISIQIRDLSRTENPMAIVFWFATLSSICSLPFMLFVAGPHDALDWLILLGTGLAGTWGQLMITAALRYGKVSSVIVMDYSAIVWATLFGWLLFAVLPPITTLFGAPLVIAAGIIIAWRERVVRRAPFTDQRGAAGT